MTILGVGEIRTIISVMPFDLTALARAGAQARLAELQLGLIRFGGQVS